MKRLIAGRHRARINALFSEMGRCDPVSQCSKQATALILIINQDLIHPAPSDERVLRSDIWYPERERTRCGLSNAAYIKVLTLFDGKDEILSRVTNQLALATVSEALLHAQNNNKSSEPMDETINVLELLENMLESDYVHAQNKEVRAKLLGHIGKGIALLQENYRASSSTKKKGFFFF
jgi:hypothetical protein